MLYFPQFIIKRFLSQFDKIYVLLLEPMERGGTSRFVVGGENVGCHTIGTVLLGETFASSNRRLLTGSCSCRLAPVGREICVH